MAKFIVHFPEGPRIVHYGMPKPKRAKPGQTIEVWDDVARPGRHVVDSFGNEKFNRPHETYADAYRCQPDLYEEVPGAPFFWRTGSGPSIVDKQGRWVAHTERRAPGFVVPKVEVTTLRDPLDEDDEADEAEEVAAPPAVPSRRAITSVATPKNDDSTSSTEGATE